MDDLDRKILRAYQANPLLSINELAEKVGLSHTPCWRRLKKMEQAGLISRVAAQLDQEMLGFRVNVIVHVKFGTHDAKKLDAFETEVCDIPEILECFSMSGESDYLLRIVARSIDDYEKFLKKTLLRLPGVASMNSSFALKTVKLTSDLPI